MIRTAGKRTKEWSSARGAIVSLTLAFGAVVFSRDLGVNAVVLGGYALAAAVFAATELGPAEQRSEPGSKARPAAGVRTGLLAAGGCTAAIALNLAADVLVYDSLRSGKSSVSGPVLWALSLAVLLATAIATRVLPAWSDAWSVPPLPGSIRLRRAFFAALALVIVGGSAARLIGLASVPWGLNADEGNRAASALSLLSGEGSRNLFSSGWLSISNVYFWLLAGVMKILGVGLAQARVLGALSSVGTLAVVVWIGLRHFGARVALLTAILGATLGVSLQFARETSDGTSTAFLWALSIAFLLEAGRRGGWRWVAAGIAGGLSLYFSPGSGLWVVLASLVCLHLAVRGGSLRLRATIAGILATAFAALLTLGPFLANVHAFPHQLFVRAGQISVFSDDNAARLRYDNPHWSTLRLLWEQLRHSLEIFANTSDAGGFWPTNEPILGGTLTLLLAVGLGWFTLSWRHTPRFTVALWFWVGFAGMVLTIDTPDLQRMAAAVPTVPLLAACVLDGTASRLSRSSLSAGGRLARAAGIVATVGAVLVATTLALQQARFYFGAYADMFRWPQTTLQGEVVADQRNALVMTVARDYGQITTGWVRLLAPRVDGAAVKSPGSQLPFPLPASSDLAFVLYPDQPSYLPYLRGVYPGGAVHRYLDRSEGLVATVYRVPRDRVAALAGSVAAPIPGDPVRVKRLGAVPPGLRLPAAIRWSGELHVPEYWDYTLRLKRGPAQLGIDGKTVLTLPAGRSQASVTLALARGRHLVTLDGAATTRADGPRVEWRTPAGSDRFGPPGFAKWRPIDGGGLVARTTPRGLLGTIDGVGMPRERRLDSAIATCCLSDDVHATGPYTVSWTGSLRAPKTGVYGMSLFTEGIASLEIDGRRVLRSRSGSDGVAAAALHLRAGRHAVILRYRVAGSPGGIEWTWTPPGGSQSIVPPAVLEPPPGGGVEARVPLVTLAGRYGQPVDVPLVVAR